ncbi:MAG TPA: ABC transporter permease [Candidatus Saccharimonadales bacterium]|nr:ABC transporter permease [Candidatus Saccharimonadales bacterium]
MIVLNIKIAVAALKSARVRTILTMVGIIVGVASVTLIMALGEGIKRQVGSEVQKFGGNVVQVRPGKINSTGLNQPLTLGVLGGGMPSTLNEHDLQTAEHTKGVEKAAPMLLVNGDVNHDGNPLANPFIIATSEDLPDVLNLHFTYGEFFHSGIDDHVVVLGSAAANKLLDTDNQLGGKISIRGQDYTVIGILDDKSGASAFGGLSPDMRQAIFIPFELGKQAYQGAAQLQEIEVKLADGRKPQQVIGDIRQNILHNHNQQEDFSVITQQQALDATSSIITVLTTFTAAIASISLLVGGIGIMNIMLVSVTERTREIGIRKSIGATNGQILSQFLIEAVVISVGGGIMGIGAAFGIGGLLSLKLDITPAITPLTLLLAFGVSTVTGIIFGIAPAIKAAHKDPIEALRYE